MKARNWIKAGINYSLQGNSCCRTQFRICYNNPLVTWEIYCEKIFY